MNKIAFIIIFGWVSTVFGQVQINLFSKDQCSGAIEKLEYILLDSNSNCIPDTLDFEEFRKFYSNQVAVPKGVYGVSYGYEIDNTNSYSVRDYVFYDLSAVTVLNDTILIPKIRLGWSNALHSNKCYYFNCSRKCDGIEVDYYENGNRKLEGEFEKGIPKRISSYRKDGSLKLVELFRNNSFEPYKSLRYDKKNDLVTYEIRTIVRKKTIIRTYNKHHKMINKQKFNYILN